MTDTSRPEAGVTLPDPVEAAGTGDEPLVSVQVLAAPMRLWERANIHTTELIREFTLVTLGRATAAQDDPAGTAGNPVGRVPTRLVELAAALQARYAGVTEAQQTEFEAALSAGAVVRDFTYRVPRAVGPACQQLQDLLDEADDYCRHGDLLTLVSPPDQRRFRRWYLQEFVRQLAGDAPVPWAGPTD